MCGKVPPGWTEFYSPSPEDGSSRCRIGYDEYEYCLNTNGDELVQYGNSPADFGTDVYAQ